MDAMFSIPVVVKSGVSPLLDLEAFIPSADGMQIQQKSGLRFIIFRTGGSVQLASLNEFRKLVKEIYGSEACSIKMCMQQSGYNGSAC
jgi:hypothetical protein